MRHFACALILVASFGSLHARDVTFEQRVEAQRAIERVLWSHRTWPETNPPPKPQLEEVLPDAELRARVEDTLRKSNALAAVWGRRIDGRRLQAELDRMVRESKAPALLEEVIAALDQDPFLVAETLVRQRLADGLIESAYAWDRELHASARRAAELAVAGRSRLDDLARAGHAVRVTRYVPDHVETKDTAAVPLGAAAWRELERSFTEASQPLRVRETATAFVVEERRARTEDSIEIATVVWPKRRFSDWWTLNRSRFALEVSPPAEQYGLARRKPGDSCQDDTWTSILDDTPPIGIGHTAVWTGSEMIVWGGLESDNGVRNGSRYDPATDTWRALPMWGAPGNRYGHTAVWTGREMIVWGGSSGDDEEHFDTGARYDPTTDAWRPTTLRGAPAGRFGHQAVWAGHEMIVWGGVTEGGGTLTGARYHPASDSWKAMSIGGAPESPSVASVWTGREFIVWGGGDGGVTAGARYLPRQNVWRPLATSGAPSPRRGHTAVWTGTEMIVWGGWSEQGTRLGDGARYRPQSDSWEPVSIEDGPAARASHTAVWTGRSMIVWGGILGDFQITNTGAQYFPALNAWSPTEVSGAPVRGIEHTAVWTGKEMIVYGGAYQRVGARYDPVQDRWTPTGPGTAPLMQETAALVWTGVEMLVWGGSYGPLPAAARYEPATNTWRTLTLEGAPLAAFVPGAVWTGREMVVFGGAVDVGSTDAAGRYDPTADTWRPVAGIGAPQPRSFHTAIWTGREMIVWGGRINGSTMPTDAGRYDPALDSWVPVPIDTQDAPEPRWAHSTVWTGSEMIVWGGRTSAPNGTHFVNTGGRYDPVTDAWSPVTLDGAPLEREEHVAVWTGEEMIVWGGFVTNGVHLSGGRYDPIADRWTPVGTSGTPAGADDGVTAVWTDAEMLVWDGYDPRGSRYDPATDFWREITQVNAPQLGLRSVWTGTHMLVWGGDERSGAGGAYCAQQPEPARSHPSSRLSRRELRP